MHEGESSEKPTPLLLGDEMPGERPAERSGAGGAEPERTEEVSTDLLPKLGPDGRPIYENYGDKYLNQLGPDRLRNAHATVAWMAAGGAKNKDIAEAVGETGLGQTQISIILNTTSVKERIKEIQKEHYGGSIDARFRQAVGPAMDVIENTITPLEEDIPHIKPALRADTARWLLEKVTGKARQEVDIKGNLFGDLLGRLDEIRSQGKTIDVKALRVVGSEGGTPERIGTEGAEGSSVTEPGAGQEEGEQEKWIRENLTSGMGEK